MLRYWLLGLLFILSPTLYAASYTVGVENIDYYPQYSVDAQGHYNGYARAILDAFAEKNGHTFVYLPFPIRRLFSIYLNNQGLLDFKYPDNPLWAQEDKKGVAVIYSKPVVRYIDGVLLPKESKGKSLKNLTSISAVRGFTVVGYEDQIKADTLAVIESNTTEAALQLVLDGRAQGVYGNVAIYSYLLDEQKLKGSLLYDPSLPHADDNYYLSSYKHPEIIEEFNQFLEKEKDLVATLKAKFKVEAGI